VRLLIDSFFWSPGIVALRRAGHDVEAERDWPADPGDRAILAFAHSHSRILVTLDKVLVTSSCATDIHMLGFGASSRIRSDYRHQWLSTLSNSLVTRSWPAPS
jgi:hypothetical protein